jgi:Flp pilus assembly protein CpaB
MLVLGVLLALVAFGAVIMFGSGGNQQAPPQTVSVVTTTVAVPLGTALDSSMLALTDVPVSVGAAGYNAPDALVGRVVRRNVTASTVLTPADFQSSGVTNAVDVTAALKPGQVGVSVSVDSLTGVGGLIQDGDFVDVVLSTSVPIVINVPKGSTEGSNGAPFTSVADAANNTSVKVLVQNVQVIGHAAAAASSDGTTQVDPNTGQPVNGPQVLILSVTPQQAELIRFGESDANTHLGLILRAPSDESAAEVQTTGVTLRELVDKYGVLPPQTVTVDYP